MKPITSIFLAGVTLSVLGASLPAHAGSVSGQAPNISGFNSVFYSFEDTLQGASFTISGKVIVNGVTTIALGTDDGFWTGTAQITLDETQDDALSIVTNLRHITPPADASTHNLASSYTSGGTILAENFDDTGTAPGQVSLRTVQFTGAPDPVSHFPHTDLVLTDAVSFTKATNASSLGGNHEITNWTYTLQVAHVPEPAPFALFGMGLLGLLGYFRMKPRLAGTGPFPSAG